MSKILRPGTHDLKCPLPKRGNAEIDVIVNFPFSPRTERRKPLEKEINLCDVLLSYLEKHSAQQTSPGIDTKETDSSSEQQPFPNGEWFFLNRSF